MTFGNEAPKEKPEIGEWRVALSADTCPVCKYGYVDRHYRVGEIGFRDNCDTCEFEGINITAKVVDEYGNLSYDY